MLGLAALVFACCRTLPAAADSGTLGQLRDEVRSPSSSSSSSSSGNSSSSSCDDDDSFLGSLVGSLFEGIFDEEGDDGSGSVLWHMIIAPWEIPHDLAGDNFQIPAYLPKFPYEPHSNDPDVPSNSPFTKCWGGHVRGEYADNFDNVSRIGGRIVLEHNSRFGIDSECNYWRENLGGGLHDQLWTGDVNLVFRFAQNEHLAMRSGLGMNWLSDPLRTDNGWNFTYGVDFFPRKPWVLSADIDWGRLGARSLFHGRATAGVTIRHAEVYVGYDYYDVGDISINGAVAGVGFWF
ncbi:MAG: hypothetical protein K8T25_04405 [Planctomycetia bacterium]|nr:hypothetical protein [Planctomycetia bacterium]